MICGSHVICGRCHMVCGLGGSHATWEMSCDVGDVM